MGTESFHVAGGCRTSVADANGVPRPITKTDGVCTCSSARHASRVRLELHPRGLDVDATRRDKSEQPPARLAHAIGPGCGIVGESCTETCLARRRDPDSRCER